MNLANTIKAMSEAKLKEKDFVPHMMYDPETGKGYKAEKPEDHERMSKLGYTHEKPEEKDLDEAFEALLDEEAEELAELKNTHAVIDTAQDGKIVSVATNEKNAKSSIVTAEKPPMNIKNKKTLKVVQLKKPTSRNKGSAIIGSYLNDDGTIARYEETVAEAKSSSGYELYHRDFSGAMQHAYAFAKKKGYVVDKDDIDQKVAFGPKKPSSGKTNKYILDTNKKQKVHIQVANLDNKRYELNMYIESVELDEDYYMVQYYDKKGKPDTTKFSKFADEKKAKKYLERGNKVSKEGEYKMFKVKGRMEGLEEATAAKKVYTKKVGQSTVTVYQYPDKKMIAMFTSKGFGETSYGIKKLDKKAIDGAVKHFDDNKGLLGGSLDSISESANPNFFGTKANYGSSDSLLAAVNAVVTGQAETVEASVEDQNEVIEQGADDVCESIEEAFSSFVVPVPKQSLNGKKIGGEEITVSARNTAEAIKKAAKKLGVDFKFMKTGKVVKEDNTNDQSDDGDGLDKVQPKAVKKKFADRKDKDIDNDGDVDDSDEFLHKKRKAISKAISKDKSENKDDKKKDKKAVDVDTSPSLEEALKNPYKKFSERDLKRKLASFESQLQDLIKKSKGRQRKEIEGEISDMETKVQQVRSALKESISESLDQEMFKAKYGSRWEAVMEATIKRLIEK